VSPTSAADYVRARSAEFGLELTVVRNSKRTYLEIMGQRGMFPSPQFRQCTSDLNRAPIEKFIRRLPHKMIVNCIGIRAEESNPRSLLSPLTLNPTRSTKNEPHATGSRSSIERSPMYRLGTGRTLFGFIRYTCRNATRMETSAGNLR
jgi:DNA sulfur modification protein DndC